MVISQLQKNTMKIESSEAWATLILEHLGARTRIARYAGQKAIDRQH